MMNFFKTFLVATAIYMPNTTYANLLKPKVNGIEIQVPKDELLASRYPYDWYQKKVKKILMMELAKREHKSPESILRVEIGKSMKIDGQPYRKKVFMQALKKLKEGKEEIEVEVNIAFDLGLLKSKVPQAVAGSGGGGSSSTAAARGSGGGSSSSAAGGGGGGSSASAAASKSGGGEKPEVVEFPKKLEELKKITGITGDFSKYFTSDELTSVESFVKALGESGKDLKSRKGELRLVVGRGNMEEKMPGDHWVYNNTDLGSQSRKSSAPHIPFSLTSSIAPMLVSVKFDEIVFDPSTLVFLSKTGFLRLVRNFLKPKGVLKFDTIHEQKEELIYSRPINYIEKAKEMGEDITYIYYYHRTKDGRDHVTVFDKNADRVSGPIILDLRNVFGISWRDVVLFTEVFPLNISNALGIDSSKAYEPDKRKSEIVEEVNKTLYQAVVDNEVAPLFESCRLVKGPYPYKGSHAHHNEFYECEGFRG